jgi:histidine kinase 2/3/4 (cytokinin receptor)
MNGVIGMTNLLMAGTKLTPQQLDYVKMAQASGNALIALINDVLDLSKIEAGKMEFESVPYNIRVEIDEALSIFDEKVHQKGVDMLVLVHDAVPSCVVGDPGRLCQVRRRFLKGFVLV